MLENNVNRIVSTIFLIVLTTAISLRAADEAAGIEFFEKKIRPVLADNCYKCHSADAEKIKGGLKLDTRDDVLKGGDTGPALVPGDPEKSLLIKAVRYADENLQMPPKNKKLSAEQVADLETWVKMGAPDPRTNAPAAIAITVPESAKKHWAYQPVRSPAPPAVKNPKWIQSPIDNFVLARQEAKGIKPSSRADKRMLIRRATYDLIGLPPTAEEVDAFAADDSPDAFGKIVDRLLASPHYGERWGRYWLDIARYADTKGYVFEEERRYPFAYTYRDYVIRALNEDLPYDQFIVQQIAADQLELGNDRRPLAALGFLTLGRRFLNNQPDIIDDRIDVVSRGLMGMTVSCARCHDHKFDPIPTKDYYSIYGVFASSEEPGEEPLLGDQALPKQYPEYLAEKKKREEESKKFREEKEAELLTKLRSQVGEYLLTATETKHLDRDKREALARERKLAPRIVNRWSDRLEEMEKKSNPIFDAWLAFASLPKTNFAENAKSLAASFAADSTATNKLNPLVAGLFTNAPVSIKEVAERYDRLFADIDKGWRAITKTNAPSSLKDTNREALRQVLYAENSPFHMESDEMYRLFDTPAQQKVRALKRKIDELDATHPGAPPRAMALVDRKSPTEPVVFVRGNPNNTGPKVRRQFLGILSGDKREPFTKGSGRLEFARAIASTKNPLTARVMVNRVWMYHFGAPLVRTTSDFGLRSDPPMHPELLDYLASEFMANGWSLKKLHRLIMLSSTYQQSSEDNSRNAKIDPGNEFLWRMNRRRLDFEAMRDTLLATSGKLDRTMGGHAVDITTEPFAARRTVYAFIERQNLPGIFRTFDFASPDTTSPQRFYTTVPQQALFLMNSPFVVEQTRSLLARPEIKSPRDDQQRIERLYRIAFQRAPDRDELAVARRFLSAQSVSTNLPVEASPWQYGFGEFDEKNGRMKRFTKLPYFTGTAWQGDAKLPDEKLGWVLLNAEGGHAGNDLQHAAIRRWRAPHDGVIKIFGQLKHESDKGDGVRGRAVSSATGSLGEWIVHNSKATTNVERVEVKRGDTIDFVTDLRGEVNSDSFIWAPRIRYVDDAGGKAGQWSAKNDFAGPQKELKPLTPWERYVQALLLSNELMFVD
jgi:mono/diheme cytochrome c family protein